MQAVIGMCIFCESHGPRVLAVCQPMRDENDFNDKWPSLNSKTAANDYYCNRSFDAESPDSGEGRLLANNWHSLSGCWWGGGGC